MAGTQRSDGAEFRQSVHRLAKGVDTLRADVHSVGHDAVGAASAGVAELREGAHHAVDAAKERLGSAKDMARDRYEDAKKATADAARSLRGVLVRHPATCIGIAAGVGLLAGLYLRRPRS